MSVEGAEANNCLNLNRIPMSIRSNLLFIPIALVGLQACNSADQKNAEDEVAKTAVVENTADTTLPLQENTAVVTVNPEEKRFILTAATAGMLEEAAASAVAQKSQSQEVKNIAGSFRKNYTAMNQELQKIATETGLSLPETLSEFQQKQLDELKNLSGRTLDVQYLTMELRHQSAALALYNTGIKLPNQSIRAFSNRNLPAIQKQLATLQQTAKRFNLSNVNNGDDILNISQENKKP